MKENYTRVSEVLAVIHKILGSFDLVDPDILERKKIIGSEVHDAIASELLLLPRKHLRADSKPYFDSFVSWSSEVGLDTIKCEERLYDDDLRITGCIDCIGLLKYQKDPSIIDWKTTASSNDLVWKLQLCMYYMLCEKNEINVSNKVLSVRLNKTGGAPVVHVYEITPELIQKCLSLIEVYRYLESSGINVNVD